MSRLESILVAALGLSAIVLATIFLPTFFSVVVIVGLVWFIIARGNGYQLASYSALALGIVLLVLIYPFDETKGSTEESAKTLAVSSGVVEDNQKLILEKIGGEGNDSVFLATSPGNPEVVLVRTSTSSVKTYSVADINKQTGENTYKAVDTNSKQNKFMFSDFKDSFPLKYGPAFIFFLLPLLLVASLPGIRRLKSGKRGKGSVFDSRDGSFLAWLAPSGPSEDARSSVGAAGTHLILVLTLAMALAFVLSAPSLSYFF